jgi:hypothetical protein
MIPNVNTKRASAYDQLRRLFQLWDINSAPLRRGSILKHAACRSTDLMPLCLPLCLPQRAHEPRALRPEALREVPKSFLEVWIKTGFVDTLQPRMKEVRRGRFELPCFLMRSPIVIFDTTFPLPRFKRRLISISRLIPTIFRTTGRNIRKRLNGIVNVSKGGTKSAASVGLKEPLSFGPKAFCRRGLDGGAKGSSS